MTVPNKSHIGRRVKSGGSFIGKLLAIADDVHPVHVIQREDGGGWRYDGDEGEPEKLSLDGRGIELGTDSLWFIESYELDDSIVEMTLEEVAKLKGVSVEKLRIRY